MPQDGADHARDSGDALEEQDALSRHTKRDAYQYTLSELGSRIVDALTLSHCFSSMTSPFLRMSCRLICALALSLVASRTAFGSVCLYPVTISKPRRNSLTSPAANLSDSVLFSCVRTLTECRSCVL